MVAKGRRRGASMAGQSFLMFGLYREKRRFSELRPQSCACNLWFSYIFNRWCDSSLASETLPDFGGANAERQRWVHDPQRRLFDCSPFPFIFRRMRDAGTEMLQITLSKCLVRQSGLRGGKAWQNWHRPLALSTMPLATGMPTPLRPWIAFRKNLHTDKTAGWSTNG